MPQESEVPEGWAFVSLDDVISPSKEKIEPLNNPDLKYVGLEHIESNKCRIIGNGLAGDVKSTKTVFHRGDLLYGKLRPYLNKVCVPDFEGVCSTDILVFNKNPYLNNHYLMWLLSTPDFVDYANNNSSGVQLPRINFQKLSKYPVPLPPLAEQHRIVAAIEALFARLDAANARLEHVPGILKQFRQVVLAAACEGRLTEDWRAEHSNIDAREYLRKIQSTRKELLQQNGKKYVEPVCLYEKEIDCLASIPNIWCWIRLEQVCRPIFRGSTPPNKDAPQKDGEIPFIKINNLTFDGSLEFFKNPFFISKTIHETERKNSKVFPGDVLLNITGPPFGKVSIVSNEFPEWNVNQAIAVFRLISVSDRYLCLFLLNSQTINRLLKNVKQTVGQMNINLQNCRDIAFPLPPLPEQHEIVRRVDALFALANRIEAKVAATRAKTETMRQSILTQAFSGRLVPTEAELARQEGRDYEPASVLLERIRSGKTERKGGEKAQSTLI